MRNVGSCYPPVVGKWVELLLLPILLFLKLCETTPLFPVLLLRQIKKVDSLPKNKSRYPATNHPDFVG
jgi:hypothetical protein